MSEGDNVGDETEERRSRQMKKIDPRRSLHLLKNDFQKRYFGVQCDELRTGLDTAIAATELAAPVRRNPYFQPREARTPEGPEARWEQAMWEQWHDARGDAVPGAWHRLASTDSQGLRMEIVY